jgi:hypothetical protein
VLPAGPPEGLEMAIFENKLIVIEITSVKQDSITIFFIYLFFFETRH